MKKIRKPRNLPYAYLVYSLVFVERTNLDSKEALRLSKWLAQAAKFLKSKRGERHANN